MKGKHRMRSLVGAVLILVLSIVGVPVEALTEEQLNRFSQNDILFYKPGAGSSENVCTGGNRNYAGATVWSSAELATIENNRAVYEKAAATQGLPWQVLAVIHSMEHGLQVDNPGNGQGIYQLYSYTDGGTNDNAFLPAGAVDMTEFQRQSDIAAEIIAGKAAAAGIEDLGNMSSDELKKLFYYYNGAGVQYELKGEKMNLTAEEIANGEASVYVMNRYDARRDPRSGSMDQYWPGRFESDGTYVEGSTSDVFGAYVKYEALTGGDACSHAGSLIANVAINLSWEGTGLHTKFDPKPEYVEAMEAVGAYIKGGNGEAPEGASCDQFVGTVMRYSGVDVDFPIFGPGEQKAYMDGNPDKYIKVETSDGDYSVLQPGDIFVTVNAGYHIYLYVGMVNGQRMQASASYNDRTAEHFEGVYYMDFGIGKGTRFYDVYRRVDFN